MTATIRHPQSLFGRRLRAARERADLAQDRLGVMIGLDEGCSSARISRYETGIHAPPFSIAESLALVLDVPVAYFFCPNETLAEVLLTLHGLPSEQMEGVLQFIQNQRRSILLSTLSLATGRTGDS